MKISMKIPLVFTFGVFCAVGSFGGVVHAATGKLTLTVEDLTVKSRDEIVAEQVIAGGQANARNAAGNVVVQAPTAIVANVTLRDIRVDSASAIKATQVVLGGQGNFANAAANIVVGQ